MELAWFYSIFIRAKCQQKFGFMSIIIILTYFMRYLSSLTVIAANTILWLFYISMSCRICHTSFAVIWTGAIFSFQVQQKLGSCCFVIFLSVACYSRPGLHRLWTCKRKILRPSCLAWLLPLITFFLCCQRFCSHTEKQPKCWHFCWHCVRAWFLPITKPVIKCKKAPKAEIFRAFLFLNLVDDTRLELAGACRFASGVRGLSVQRCRTQICHKFEYTLFQIKRKTCNS